VFSSAGLNLSPHPDGDWQLDVYRHDRVTGMTELISRSTKGIQQDGDATFSGISPDGGYVIFWSRATNLVEGSSLLDDRLNKQGLYQGHIFVRDVRAGTTTLECVNSAGDPANDVCPTGAALSWGGRYSVFMTYATNMPTGLPVSPDVPRNDVDAPSDPVVNTYVRDRVSGVVERVSVSTDGNSTGDLDRRGNGLVGGPLRWTAISWDGRFVAFDSAATDLVDADTNNAVDVFVRDLFTRTTIRASVSTTDEQGTRNRNLPSDPADSDFVSLTADGRAVVFDSRAANFGADRSELPGAFLRSST